MPRDANEIYRQKLREKLEAAVAKAMPLALVGKFDAAEQTVREVDREVYGWLAMARMYIAAIAALGGEKASHSDRVTVMAMFDRAVAHRELAYPMPHTKEESDRYSIGQSQDRSKVVQEIGFDPKHWPTTCDYRDAMPSIP